MKTMNDFIYSSVETQIEEISSEKERILYFLKKQGEKPTTAREICKALNLKSSKTEVALRKAITELIENSGEPIISTAKGFMYTSDPEKIKDYLETLQMRIDGIERRKSALIDIRTKLMKQKEE